MSFRTFIAVIFMIGYAASVTTLTTPCSGTGNCRLLGTSCTSPSDSNLCTVTWNNTVYPCNSPPAGFINPVITCYYDPSSACCRANGRASPPPNCIWTLV